MFEAAVGSSVQPVADVGKGLYNSLKQKYIYVKNIDKNFRMLQVELRYLYAKEADANGVIEKNSPRMEKTIECATWLEQVQTTKIEFESLENRYNASKCFCGLCPFRFLLQLSKDIEEKTGEVQILRDRISMDNIVKDRRPAVFEHRHPRRDDVPSMKENVQKLLNFLADSTIKRIGIWGGPGVGKTTIMEHLNDEAGKLESFDIVIWVDVPNEGSIGEIQKLLANRLQLRIEDVNTDQVAGWISASLEKKKYLLLLDDVNSEIDLSRVGIHDDHQYGKVVLASRLRSVCNLMDVHDDINVERLSREDAWVLFQDTVGDAANYSRIKPIAERVLKECGGLPQLIKAVGKNMRNVTNESLWRNKLKKLQSPARSRLQGMEEALKAFKLVYDELGTDRKNCLLYGALFPEDHEIYQDYLIECWNSEKFILDALTYSMARDEGHSILEDLINTSLMERCKTMEYIKMPMLFRNMALQVMYPNEEGSKLLVPSGDDVTAHPAQEEWNSARRISLMCTELESLPENPKCCTISTLLLQKNGALRVIPESFFAYMCDLRVLDLCKTGIKSLPSTISNLFNLRGLYLNDCIHLVELPNQIAELKNLEVLDLRRTGIRSLPTVIGELVGLMCLRVSFSENISNHNHITVPHEPIIPRNVIAKLSRLEALTIIVDPKEQSWNENVDDIAREVASLKTLTTLHFYFPRITCFESFIEIRESSENEYPVRSFRIFIGSYEKHHGHGLITSGDLAEGYLRFSNGESFPEAISKVLDRVSTFELISHCNVQSLSDFKVDRIRGMKACLVKECKEMESIIKGNVRNGAAFPDLEKLHVVDLPKLRRIWEGSLEAGSLSNLTTLTLSGCLSLERLLIGKITQHLPRLQHLKVEKCSEIKEIIEDNNQLTMLPNLRFLQLVHLPNLVYICSNANLTWPSLEKIEITGCDQLKSLPFSTDNASRIKKIECEEVWWNALEDGVKNSLKLFCRFV